MEKLNLEQFKNKLASIGSKSLQLIGKHRVNKGESWSLAVEINTIAHNLHDQLKKDPDYDGFEEWAIECRLTDSSRNEG